MSNQVCEFCKNSQSEDSIGLTYVLGEELKDYRFCSADCRRKFMEFYQNFRDSIYNAFSTQTECKR
jgi:ribosomal protein L24E